MTDITNVFCRTIDNVYLEGNLNNYDMLFVIGVIEDDEAVRVQSASKIKGLERGWFGNLNCKTNKAFEPYDGKILENVNPIHCIKDVVLQKIQIENESREYPTYFTYVFLKI